MNNGGTLSSILSNINIITVVETLVFDGSILTKKIAINREVKLLSESIKLR